MSDSSTLSPADVDARPSLRSSRGRRRRWLTALSPKRISAIYLAAILFAYFAYRLPELFFRYDTWTTMLSQQSTTIIVAIGILIPVVTGVFDISVAYTLGLSSTVLSLLIVKQEMAWPLACGLVIVVGAIVGLINAFIITVLKVNSLIATLGLGTVVGSIDLMLSTGTSNAIYDEGFLKIGSATFFGITPPVFIALALTAVAWFVLEHTPVGRRGYAIGGSISAARLAGIPAQRYIVVALVSAGVMGAIGGILITARIGANSPGIAASFVLPGFAAVFLGATQFKDGRVNAWGTVVAILALAVGTKGFDFIGVRLWIHDFFYGVALIGAMAMSVWSKRSQVEPNGMR